MPLKSDPQSQSKSIKTGANLCNYRSPGPKYELRSVVGHRLHCLTKNRNPAYTIAPPYKSARPCEGPGPKYQLDKPKRGGYSFGVHGKYFDPSCTPGPKYELPSPKGVAFKLKDRTKPRKGSCAPGPYSLKRPIGGPAYSMGLRTPGLKCDAVPAGRHYNDRFVYLRAPVYSITSKHPVKELCVGPGPKYDLKLSRITPLYSFGIKHSECSRPYILKCDDLC